MGARGRGQRETRGRLPSALTSGDRPFVLILAVLIVVAIGMALGPLQVFTAAADRVEELEQERDRLEEGIEELEERRDRLEDPEEVERLARSDLGMVRPGEIPFVLIPPEADTEPEADADVEEADEGGPWYRRLGRWLGDRVGPGG